ncbi:bromodomain-containing protein 8-like isoform X1 [Limulus polyphemus]|uniref:Bromodomain-containing protein 8-like isoform X1 n=1 Tax=Limulus polyphemus TaxID=6850 RepID=A0ABM1B4W1_LIMPO|nr:bromodomain-containing protein 8-like isoform X1 [Limulus polyphemus]
MAVASQKLKLKQTPTDKWSAKEKLCLASSVLRSGDQNWVSVSRAIKPFAEPNRPPDWFSQKNCALQYSDLLENVETPKRKRGEKGDIETPGDVIIRKLTIERIEELKKFIQEEQQKHKKLKREIELVRSGHADDKLEEMWNQIQEENKAKQAAEAEHQVWLQEREAKIAAFKASKAGLLGKTKKPGDMQFSLDVRRNSSQSEQSEHENTVDSPLSEPLSVEVEDDSSPLHPCIVSGGDTSLSTTKNVLTIGTLPPVVSTPTPSPTTPGVSSTSPLLTSLLRSPTAATPASPGVSMTLSACGVQPKEGSVPTTSQAIPRPSPTSQPFFNPTSALATAAARQLAVATASVSSVSPSNTQPEISESLLFTSSPSTSSAPTLSKLLELPPSLPGKLPSLPILFPKDAPSVNIPSSTFCIDATSTATTTSSTTSQPASDSTIVADTSSSEVTEAPTPSNHIPSNIVKENEASDSLLANDVTVKQELPEVESEHSLSHLLLLDNQTTETENKAKVEESEKAAVKDDIKLEGTDLERISDVSKIIREEESELFSSELEKKTDELTFALEKASTKNENKSVLQGNNSEGTEQSIQSSCIVQDDHFSKPSFSKMKASVASFIEMSSVSEIHQACEDDAISDSFSKPSTGSVDEVVPCEEKQTQQELQQVDKKQENMDYTVTMGKENFEDENNSPLKLTCYKKLPNNIPEKSTIKENEKEREKNEDDNEINVDNQKLQSKSTEIKTSMKNEGKTEEKADHEETLVKKEIMETSQLKDQSQGLQEPVLISNHKETLSETSEKPPLPSTISDPYPDNKPEEVPPPPKKVKRGPGRPRKYPLPQPKPESKTDTEQKISQVKHEASKLLDGKEKRIIKQEPDEDGKSALSSQDMDMKEELPIEELLSDTKSKAPSSVSDSVPNSPSSTSQGEDVESQRDYKVWKKAIMLVWRAAANHKYASVFLQPVTNEVAPGYHSIVYRPMDLSAIKKNIENGIIKTTLEFQRDMMLMFQNAIMYNSSDHDVFVMAIEMQKEVMEHIQDFLATQLMVQTADTKVLRGRERETREKKLENNDKEEEKKKKPSSSDKESKIPKKRPL